MTPTVRLACFGDSLTDEYFSYLEGELARRHPQRRFELLAHAVRGETAVDGLARLDAVTADRPDVTALYFGMNDQERGVGALQFADTMRQIIDVLYQAGSEVLLLTLNPVAGHAESATNRRIAGFNNILRELAYETHVRCVDIEKEWAETFSQAEEGLRDGCHPNEAGAALFCREIARVVQRRSRIILWQYNGNPAQCNYHCEYCSYDSGKLQVGHHFQRETDDWRRAFEQAFGAHRHLVFYFGHGEPMVGKRWFDVVEMIGSQPNWEMRVITNLSPALDPLLDSRVAREGRLNINASFHPTQVSKERFRKKLVQCREQGIEVPVVYVLWPPFFERFEEDLAYFDEMNFLVHPRRFRGVWNGREYPQAYTETQRQLLARYMDAASIKLQLSNECSAGKPTWTGVDFCIVDNKGNVGYCDDYRTDAHHFGNIFAGNVRMYLHPHPFPDVDASDGTIDGVANFCELEFDQIEGNHIAHAAAQGNVYRREDGTICYGNADLDFDDPAVRAEYRFPARNLRDARAILVFRGETSHSRLRRLAEAMFPERFNYRSGFSVAAFVKHVARGGLKRVPLIGPASVSLHRLVRGSVTPRTQS